MVWQSEEKRKHVILASSYIIVRNKRGKLNGMNNNKKINRNKNKVDLKNS